MELTKKQQHEVDSETWKSLQRHVTRGEEALQLLEDVYLSVGRGQSMSMSEEVYIKLEKFFGYDDSE